MKYKIRRFYIDRQGKKHINTETVRDSFKVEDEEIFIQADLKANSKIIPSPNYSNLKDFMTRTTGETDIFGIESIESESFGPWKYVVRNNDFKDITSKPRWWNGHEDIKYEN